MTRGPNNAPTEVGTLLSLDRDSSAGRTVLDAQVATKGASSPFVLTGGFNNRAADGSKIDPLTGRVTFANAPSQMDVHVDSDTAAGRISTALGDQRSDDDDCPGRRGQGRCESFPAGHHQPASRRGQRGPRHQHRSARLPRLGRDRQPRRHLRQRGAVCRLGGQRPPDPVGRAGGPVPRLCRADAVGEWFRDLDACDLRA